MVYDYILKEFGANNFRMYSCDRKYSIGNYIKLDSVWYIVIARMNLDFGERHTTDLLVRNLSNY